MVWNFGSLKTQKIQSADSKSSKILDTETEYIRKMVEKMVSAFSWLHDIFMKEK